MEFNKYKERGAYHWKEYELKTPYGLHADKVGKWIADGKTLDIGAGDGLITHLLNAEGIDDDQTAVKLAIEKGVDVKLGDAYKLDYEDDSFDNILMGDVIEHLEFPDIAVKEVKRVLKADGLFYVVTPPAKKVGLHDKYHYREYNPKELKKYLESQDFELIEPIEVVDEYIRMYGVFRNIK